MRRWSSAVRPDLPKLARARLPRQRAAFAPSLEELARRPAEDLIEVAPIDDIAMIAGHRRHDGQPKGVMLSGRNLEAMSALTLMSYPFEGRPIYLALAPLTHAAGVLCLPIMALGGRIVIMHRRPISASSCDLIERHRVTHTFLPPTLIYMLLEHPSLARDGSFVAAMLLVRRGADLGRAAGGGAVKIGPVMAQLFGQTEAPMMISTMAPRDHFNADGSVATRTAVLGRAAGPLVQRRHHGRRRSSAAARRARRDRGARLAGDGGLLQEPRATAEASAHRLAPHRRHRLPR